MLARARDENAYRAREADGEISERLRANALGFGCRPLKGLDFDYAHSQRLRAGLMNSAAPRLRQRSLWTIPRTGLRAGRCDGVSIGVRGTRFNQELN